MDVPDLNSAALQVQRYYSLGFIVVSSLQFGVTQEKHENVAILLFSWFVKHH